MLKKTFLILSIFSLSTEIFSETYVCSYDTEQHIDGGKEIMSVIYKRKGKEFVDTTNDWVFTIEHESKKSLLLKSISKGNEPSVLTVIIDKETMDYGVDFLKLKTIMNDERSRTIGKCVEVN